MSDQEFSLLDLFRDEVLSHTATLARGLLALEADPANPQRIEPLMRAAHSIKGAARIVGLDAPVGLAHVMEDALVAAQNGRIRLESGDIDVLLRGSDLLAELGKASEAAMRQWNGTHQEELSSLVSRLQALARGETVVAPTPAPAAPVVLERSPPRVIVPREPILPGDEQPLFDLFREEVRVNTLLLIAGLDQVPTSPEAFEDLVRAVHAIRGAARLVGLDPVATLAARMEEGLSAMRQAGTLSQGDSLRAGTSFLAGLLDLSPETASAWVSEHESELRALGEKLLVVGVPPPATDLVTVPSPVRMPVGPVVPVEPSAPTEQPPPPASAEPGTEAVVRVTAQSLNRLMNLAGESLVQARWLQPFSLALLKLKKHQDRLAGLIDQFNEALAEGGRRSDRLETLLDETRRQSSLCRQVLAERMREFEEHAGQAEDLNSRLYREVIVSRMRPFADGAHGFPRLVRDMARKLDKQVRLEIDGLTTEVDRDILERLEAPLMHLLRNALDHGIEPPGVRRAAGKPEQGTIRIDVRHRAGMLAITVGDDGGGIDLERLERKVVERGLTTADMASHLSEAELLEFLFLPGFSTAQAVTEYSGRGVGLDVVQDTLRRVGGTARITTRAGQGTTFHLQLPVTLSVLRAVLVDIAGEPYAFPHNRIDRLLRVPRSAIRSLEHRQYLAVDGRNVGLVLAAQLMDLQADPPTTDELPVVLLSDDSGVYGLIVESFRGEQDLVVRPLDVRLGKVPCISAAAILDDGFPVLIADVEDLIRSMDHFIQSGSLRRCDVAIRDEKRKKRILVVDDSITVREVERQLLRHAGFDVDVAVDGKDGWNQLRLGGHDLVVTDVDMPRMTGLELVKLIRDHEATRDLPILVVSYKDREEDRLRGLELGANYYLTKSSFHDDTFLRAVVDLIGEA